MIRQKVWSITFWFLPLCFCSSLSNWLNQTQQSHAITFTMIVDLPTGSLADSQSVLPSLCTPSPWWLWWAVWPSAWWALRSERHTVPQGRLQTPRHSPATQNTSTLKMWHPVSGQSACRQAVCCSRHAWPRSFRVPGFELVIKSCTTLQLTLSFICNFQQLNENKQHKDLEKNTKIVKICKKVSVNTSSQWLKWASFTNKLRNR